MNSELQFNKERFTFQFGCNQSLLGKISGINLNPFCLLLLLPGVAFSSIGSNVNVNQGWSNPLTPRLASEAWFKRLGVRGVESQFS